MHEQISAAIDTFYDSVGDRFDLARSAKALSEAADDTGVLFSYKFPMRGEPDSLVHHNFPEEAVASLLKRQFDVQAHKMFSHLDTFPEFTHVTRQSYVPDEDHFKTRIYQEVLRPWNIHSEGLSILKKDGLDSLSCWSIRHPEQTIIDPDLLQLLSFLSKQLASAMRVQERIDELEKSILRYDRALDLLDFGLVLYDASPKPLFINATARSILTVNDGIEYTRAGIRLSDREADRKLQTMLTKLKASNIPHSARSGGGLSIARPSGKAPITIRVIPILQTTKLDFNQSSIALLVFDPELRSSMSLEMLQSAYGLTKTEATLAIGLTTGNSAEQIAAMRGVSINTVRTQLRSLFSKTETSRQAELIGVVIRSFAGVVSHP